MNKQFLTRRAQMAFVGVGLWFLLALWSISAFWRHVDELGETYQTAAKCGAMASEFALLALVLWHCFDKHLGVRRWSLIFSFVLSGVILIHAGALRGITEAANAQIETEKRMADTLSQMSKEQASGIKADQTGTLRERLAKSRAALAQQAEIAKSAQKEVAATIAGSSDKVKESAILPRWYLDGWMYSLLFILSLGFVGIIFLLMMRDDVDSNFDGVRDKDQPELFGYPEGSDVAVSPLAARVSHLGSHGRRRVIDSTYSPDEVGLIVDADEDLSAELPARNEPQQKPRAVWRGGERIDPGYVHRPKGNGADRPH